jgi:hypothetical protein
LAFSQIQSPAISGEFGMCKMNAPASWSAAAVPVPPLQDAAFACHQTASRCFRPDNHSDIPPSVSVRD